jgi:hypothetical protein
LGSSTLILRLMSLHRVLGSTLEDKKKSLDEGVAQSVSCLPCKLKAMSSNPSDTKQVSKY